MASVFLVVGGWQEPAETFGRFVKATIVDDTCKIALVLLDDVDIDTEEVSDKYRNTFASLGVAQEQLDVIWVSKDKPLVVEKLRELSPTGIFVGGGTTPLYQAALCKDSRWVAYLHDKHLPYGGFSAGAVIAAKHAVLALKPPL